MEEKQIIWSHSRLNRLLENPAEYFLIYEEGIKPKQEKAALSLGSAVHWGLEHNTSDLTEFYKEKGLFLEYNDYTDERCLAECIIECYLKNKIEIYKNILTNKETGEIEQLLDEQHELQLTAEYPSKIFNKPHQFLGIIDLLFLTQKGFILLDYKTSSRSVDWDQYKSQLYKYIHLLQFNFPEFPIWKIGIINLKKTNIRRKKNENDESFKNRIKTEYDLNEEDLLEVHIYEREEFDDSLLKAQQDDFSEMMDAAQTMINNKWFFTNYSNIVNQYGPSPYYDFFFKIKGNASLYTIRDLIYDEDEDCVKSYRDCEELDMLLLGDKNKVLNKYEIFKKEVEDLKTKGIENTNSVYEDLKKRYICEDKLLKKYMLTYKKGF